MSPDNSRGTNFGRPPTSRMIGLKGHPGLRGRPLSWLIGHEHWPSGRTEAAPALVLSVMRTRRGPAILPGAASVPKVSEPPGS